MWVIAGSIQRARLVVTDLRLERAMYVSHCDDRAVELARVLLSTDASYIQPGPGHEPSHIAGTIHGLDVADANTSHTRTDLSVCRA